MTNHHHPANMMDKEIQGLLKLESAADKAPWGKSVAFVTKNTSRAKQVICSFVNCDGATQANLALVVAMRNALPGMLKHIQEQAAEIERLSTKLYEARTYHGIGFGEP